MFHLFIDNVHSAAELSGIILLSVTLWVLLPVSSTLVAYFIYLTQFFFCY
jgi:hypothetical protein